MALAFLQWHSWHLYYFISSYWRLWYNLCSSYCLEMTANLKVVFLPVYSPNLPFCVLHVLIGHLPRWTYYFIQDNLEGSREMTPVWHQLLMVGARGMGPLLCPTQFDGRQLPGVIPAQPFRCLGRGTCGRGEDDSYSDWPWWHGFEDDTSQHMTLVKNTAYRGRSTWIYRVVLPLAG